MGEKDFNPFSIQNNCQNARKLNEIVARWSSYFSQAYQNCDKEEYPVALKEDRKWDISSHGSKGRPPSIVLLGDESLRITSFRLGFLRLVSKQTFAFRCQYVFNLKGTTISEYESKIEFLSSFSVNAKLDNEIFKTRQGCPITFSKCRQFDNDVCLEFPNPVSPIEPKSGVFYEYAQKSLTRSQFEYADNEKVSTEGIIKTDYPIDFVRFYLFPIVYNSLVEFYRKDFPVEKNFGETDEADFSLPLCALIKNYGTW